MEQYFPLKERIGNNDDLEENEISKEREKGSENESCKKGREGTDLNGTDENCADESSTHGTDCERESAVVKKETSWAEIVTTGEIKSNERRNESS